MNRSGLDKNANSEILSIVLMVAIAIIIAALILSQIIILPRWNDNTVPAIFKITKIRHTDDYGRLTFESYVVMVNSGTRSYDNWNLYAIAYRDGVQLPAEIPTLNADEQINDHNHHGVQSLWGSGVSGSRRDHDGKWNPGALLAIEFSRGTFHPEDVVMIEVYDKTTRTIISRDTWPHPDPRTTVSWWVSVFTRRQAP